LWIADSDLTRFLFVGYNIIVLTVGIGRVFFVMSEVHIQVGRIITSTKRRRTGNDAGRGCDVMLHWTNWRTFRGNMMPISAVYQAVCR